METSEARALREQYIQKTTEKQNVLTVEDEVRKAKGLPTVDEERAIAEEARRREAEEQALSRKTASGPRLDLAGWSSS